MLAESNRHINDGRISFDEANHDYFVDGKKIKFSVTEIIDKFFPKSIIKIVIIEKIFWSVLFADEDIQKFFSPLY